MKYSEDSDGTGHNEGHTCLTYDGTGRYIITGGTDGDVRIHKGFGDRIPKVHHIGGSITALVYRDNFLYIGTDNTVLAYTFPTFVCQGTILQFLGSVTHITCSNSGRYIAAGGCDSSLHVYDRLVGRISLCNIHNLTILSLAFDPAEKYLASTSYDGCIKISTVPGYKCVFSKAIINIPNDIKHSRTCGLQWHPKNGEILLVTAQRCIMFFQRATWDCLFLHEEDQLCQILSLAAFSPCGRYVAASSNDGFLVVYDLAKSKSVLTSRDIDEKKICGLAWNPSGNDEFIASNIEADWRKVSLLLNEKTNTLDSQLPTESTLQNRAPPLYSPLKLLEPYVVWNSIGIVKFNKVTNTVVAKFHDASVHPRFNLEARKLETASLSKEALLLVFPKSNYGASKVLCFHFDSWHHKKKWSYEVDETEDIEAIALGDGWAAVATSWRLLRLFTITGLQTELFSIPGPVAYLAASGMQLAIAYLQGTVSEGYLRFMSVSVDLTKGCICRDISLPLSDKSFLAWMGYSDEGGLCIADTFGIIRMLCKSRLDKWIPILDMKTHVEPSCNYFVTGISEQAQIIRYITFMEAGECPAVAFQPFSLPLWGTTNFSRLEEQMLRTHMLRALLDPLSHHDADVMKKLQSVKEEINTKLLKMFIIATKADRCHRALQIAQCGEGLEIITDALKYVTDKSSVFAEHMKKLVKKHKCKTKNRRRRKKKSKARNLLELQ